MVNQFLQAVLCYVAGQWAYFTTQELEKQWGDDWNDAPYEHNAGSPYRFSKYDEEKGRAPWEIIEVGWSGPFKTPCDDHYPNSPFSVKQINAGAIAWLRSENLEPKNIHIPAGTTLKEFIRLIQCEGGQVYVPISRVKKWT